MLNLSHNSSYFNLADSEIGDRVERPKLPRHISALESPAHSRKTRSRSSLFQTVRQCPLPPQSSSKEVTNLAVSILQYQLQDTSQQKHLENLRSNLKHRLEVAQATANKQLVTMLQEEWMQLERVSSI